MPEVLLLLPAVPPLSLAVLVGVGFVGLLPDELQVALSLTVIPADCSVPLIVPLVWMRGAALTESAADLLGGGARSLYSMALLMGAS